MRRSYRILFAYSAYSAVNSWAFSFKDRRPSSASERLKLEVPRIGGVLLNRPLASACGRQFVHRHSRSPGLCKGGFDFGRRHVEVHQEFCVAAASTVIRSSRRHWQKPIHELEIEIQ